jgi:hypothetical protein
MATVLEECISKKQCSVVRFLWSRGFNVKYIHKETFLFTVESVYGVKLITTG